MSSITTTALSFRLNHLIFNGDLYTKINNFWFAGLPVNATTPPGELLARWYGGGGGKNKKTFDEDCRQSFKSVLESIGPENLALPPFTSYQQDCQDADSLAAPFLRELRKKDVANDDVTATNTALSLILLLDQLPRNVFRDEAKVFTHYDRLSLALLFSLLDLTETDASTTNSKGSVGSRVDMHPSVLLRPVYCTWFYLPLMHSEYLPHHALYNKLISAHLYEVERAGDAEGAKFIQLTQRVGEKHTAILNKFGRYPYRNSVLGRKWTTEERLWVKAGGDTFGAKV